jgi:hypothetical protein
MTISAQEITGKEQWDGFLTSQLRGHLHQKDYHRQLLRQFASKLFPFPIIFLLSFPIGEERRSIWSTTTIGWQKSTVQSHRLTT